jgi:hypothetical protein
MKLSHVFADSISMCHVKSPRFKSKSPCFNVTPRCFMLKYHENWNIIITTIIINNNNNKDNSNNYIYINNNSNEYGSKPMITILGNHHPARAIFKRVPLGYRASVCTLPGITTTGSRCSGGGQLEERSSSGTAAPRCRARSKYWGLMPGITGEFTVNNQWIWHRIVVNKLNKSRECWLPKTTPIWGCFLPPIWVILGMVYYCIYHIISLSWIIVGNSS